MANEVVQAKGTALSADIMSDLMQDSGEGTVFNSDEMQIPYIRMAQTGNPQLKKQEGKYINGLAAGDIFNNLTNQYWDGEKGIKVIPCFMVTKYIEWIPKPVGGFVREIPPADPILTEVTRVTEPAIKDILPNGNEMVVTDNIFCLVMDDGNLQPAVIDMKVSSLKVSRRWKTQIAMMPSLEVTYEGKVVKWKPPSFGSVWNLTVVTETKKNSTETYYNYSVQRDQILNPWVNPEDKEIYDEAKLFHLSVKSGEVKAAPEETPTAPLKNDDIPF
jgi:hypothetical protein